MDWKSLHFFWNKVCVCVHEIFVFVRRWRVYMDWKSLHFFWNKVCVFVCVCVSMIFVFVRR